jgi:hypothetical protein
MSKFIDIHSLGRYSDKELKSFQELPIDEVYLKFMIFEHDKILQQ